MFFRFLAVVLTAFALAACGGGGGSDVGAGGGVPPVAGTNPVPDPSPIPGPNPIPNPNPRPDPIASKPIYESKTFVTDRPGLLAQLNAQGNRGFFYLSAQAFDIDPATNLPREIVNVYAKDLNTTYTYEILNPPSSSATFAAQANAQGARGYDFLGSFVAGLAYVKDNSSSAIFAHEVLNGTDTSASFLSQKNAQGSRGLYFSGDYVFDTTSFPVSIYSIFTKNSASSSTYSYLVQPGGQALPGGSSALLTQANAQGQQGYRYVGAEVFLSNAANEQIRNIYETDTSQASTFVFAAQNIPANTTAFITAVNTNGQLGKLYYGDLAFLTADPAVATFAAIYYTPANCAGILCRVSSPL